MAKKPPKSGFSGVGRLARLGTLTSKVSGSYLGQRIRGTFQAEEHARSRSERRIWPMRNDRIPWVRSKAAMKLGQSIAVAAEGLDVSPEARRILARLQDKGEPVPFEDIRAQIEYQLDAPLEKLLDRIDPEPLGTASLAQAHAAWLPDGTPVVVKVLHAGIERSVATDVRAMRTLFVTGRLLGRDRKEVDQIFTEIQERLKEELDYYKEAANLELFHRELAHIDGLRIPRTYGEYVRTGSHDGSHHWSALGTVLGECDSEARQRAGTLP